MRSNGCEFIRIRLDNPKPAAFIFDKKAFPTSGQANRGIFCRKDILYVAYPPIAQAEIMPIAQSTWNQQNQPQFSTNTIIATLSGGTWAASGTPVVINPPAASLNLPTVTGGGGVCCFVPSSSETPGVREGEFIFSCGV